MKSVDHGQARRRFGTAHLLDLLVREAIGLKVGQAPVRIAVAGAAACRPVVGLNGLRLPPKCLQRVSHRKMQLRMIRSLFQQLAVQAKSRLALAQFGADGRLGRQIGAVFRLDLLQHLDLLARLPVLVPLQQDLNVVKARRPVIGFHAQHVLKQQLGIIQDVQLHADLRQQPHAFNVITVRQQIAAHQAFGALDLPIGEHAAGRDDLGRKRGELGDVRGGRGSVGSASVHAIQRLQGTPARRQRRIEPYGTLECLDSFRRPPLHDPAVTALLVGSGVLRVQRLQPLQRGERRIDAPLQPLRDGKHVEPIAALGLLSQECASLTLGLCELALLERLAHSSGCGLRHRAFGLHRTPGNVPAWT